MVASRIFLGRILSQVAPLRRLVLPNAVVLTELLVNLATREELSPKSAFRASIRIADYRAG
jgi:hypothetical protein